MKRAQLQEGHRMDKVMKLYAGEGITASRRLSKKVSPVDKRQTRWPTSDAAKLPTATTPKSRDQLEHDERHPSGKALGELVVRLGMPNAGLFTTRADGRAVLRRTGKKLRSGTLRMRVRDATAVADWCDKATPGGWSDFVVGFEGSPPDPNEMYVP